MFVMSRFVIGLGIPFAIVAASSLIGGVLFSPKLIRQKPKGV
jgi:hypothetical protein